jgi:hypothetical protein
MPATDTASTIYAEGGAVWEADTGSNTGSDTGNDTGGKSGGIDPTTLSPGEALINVSGEAYGQSFSDQCTGTVSLTVKDGAISGTSTCEFQAELADLIKGEQLSDVSGAISDSDASGLLSLQLSDQDISFKWSGTTDGTAIYGAFEGSSPLEAGGFSIVLNYFGGFHATK